MAKVITFSKTFPAYHPKAGHSTYFVEKFIKSFDNEEYEPSKNFITKTTALGIQAWYNLTPKYHTIRSGKRWKKGEYFSPRIWSDKPYRSPMIKIAPDTLITNVWDFEIKDGLILINNQVYAYSSSTELLDALALNDGLSQIHLLEWFKYPNDFKGQIICWNENVKY